MLAAVRPRKISNKVGDPSPGDWCAPCSPVGRNEVTLQSAAVALQRSKRPCEPAAAVLQPAAASFASAASRSLNGVSPGRSMASSA